MPKRAKSSFAVGEGVGRRILISGEPSLAGFMQAPITLLRSLKNALLVLDVGNPAIGGGLDATRISSMRAAPVQPDGFAVSCAVTTEAHAAC